jgi:hypothetical protein
MSKKPGKTRVIIIRQQFSPVFYAQKIPRGVCFGKLRAFCKVRLKKFTSY